jgi:hypothetical protein
MTIKTIEKTISYDGIPCDLVVTLKLENYFAITGSIYKAGRRAGSAYMAGGCIHEEIEKHCPELAYLIKWHLCGKDKPMHYVANTVYHASDKDCHGLRLGEKRQILRGGKTPVWQAVVIDGQGNEIDVRAKPWIGSETQPENDGDIKYIPLWRVGEGKEPNLEAARSCAIWPDATLEQLQDEAQLLARLPQLMADFNADMQKAGLL